VGVNIDDAIRGAVAGLGGFDLLAVFGSRALGTAREDSDLDIAVLPTSADPNDRRRLQSGLAAALADLAPGGSVDVVLLDEAPELLRHGIFSTGRLVAGNDAAWREWRVRTMREHGDREHYRNMMREAQRRRLQEGRDGRSGRALESARRTGKLPR